MKKRNDNKKKDVKKIKKTEDSKVNKRRNQSGPDLWKEIRSNLKPLGKAYIKFREKRKITKQKEEERRLKEEKKQRLIEEESLRLQEQEERRFKKEKKIKEEKERRLKAQEEQRSEEKRVKEEREDQIKKEQIYRERLIKGEEERIKQLERVSELREEERKLIEERNLRIDSRSAGEQRIKDEEQRLKEKEQRLKDVRSSDDEQRKKGLNGTVKWFNDAKGFGFIKREDKEKDVFVHFSAVQNSGLKYLKKGDQLTFEVEYSDKGPSAVNLQKTVNKVPRSHLKVIK